jgi:hypothetical protein
MAEERGFKTDLTNVDPETGQMTWSVEYTANFDELYKEVSQLLDDAKGVAQKTNDPFFKDYYNDVRKLRNQLRTYLRNEYPQEYAKMKGVDEISTSGAAGSYDTKYAFGKKPVNYYYKLGYKPVNKKELRKKAKGIEVKQLFEK